MDVEHRIGMSLTSVGYGIDCSGFVGEVAKLSGLNNHDMGARAMMKTPLARTLKAIEPNDSKNKVIGWQYVRAGDFMASRGHVVYARGRRKYDRQRGTYVYPIIHADYRANRVRIAEWAQEMLDGYRPRRWIASR